MLIDLASPHDVLVVKKMAVLGVSQTMSWVPTAVHRANTGGCKMINELREKKYTK